MMSTYLFLNGYSLVGVFFNKPTAASAARISGWENEEQNGEYGRADNKAATPGRSRAHISRLWPQIALDYIILNLG